MTCAWRRQAERNPSGSQRAPTSSTGDAGRPFPGVAWSGCNWGRLPEPPSIARHAPVLREVFSECAEDHPAASRTGTERPAEPHHGKAPLSTEHHTPPSVLPRPGQSAASVSEHQHTAAPSRSPADGVEEGASRSCMPSPTAPRLARHRDQDALAAPKRPRDLGRDPGVRRRANGDRVAPASARPTTLSLSARRHARFPDVGARAGRSH